MIHFVHMKNNIQLTPKQSEALRHIRNRIAHYGKAPSIRELMAALGYKSPHSASLIIAELIDKGLLRKRLDGNIQMLRDLESDSYHARTVNVPLVGTVSCGSPILAEENIEGVLPVSTNLAKSGHKYFLLRTTGNSMNKAGINDGDLVLVRQQPTANEGDLVVALIDDKATIKKLRKVKGAIVLEPQSTAKEHKPIILTDDFQVQGVVEATIPNFN